MFFSDRLLGSMKVQGARGLEYHQVAESGQEFRN